MLTGLLLSAFLMGLGGMAHCAAMCGMACSVALPKGVPLMALLGRSLGYAALGAMAAASAGVIAQLGREVAFLQPFWIMLLAAAVVLGLWLAFTGRMPAMLDHWGLGVYRRTRARWQAWAAAHAGAWWQPAWPLLAGALWAFLPCALLYGALMLAALAPDAAGGAAVMLVFSVPSAFGVWAAPWVLGRLLRRSAASTGAAPPPGPAGLGTVAPVLWLRLQPVVATDAPPAVAPPQEGSRGTAWMDPRWAVRLAGLGMAAMAGWGISHHLWMQYQAWCA